MHKISFNCDLEKTLEVLLWVMNQKAEGVNLYNLIKTIFHADCYHLNQYGRPITGDVYIAMVHGTVPSFIYNLLNQESFALSDLRIDVLPFERKGCHYLISKRSFNPLPPISLCTSIEFVEF
jgi:hypothetical protein